VNLPKEYHLQHKMFLRKDDLSDQHGEEDLDLYESIHNSKRHPIFLTVAHIVLEVYLWLGNKYTKEFVEMDLCTVLI
jgi:hypothetical protein